MSPDLTDGTKYTGSDNALVSLGNNTLPELMLTQMCHHMESLDNELDNLHSNIIIPAEDTVKAWVSAGMVAAW